jgi:branched-chain amino acid transport system permease protein
MSADQPMDATDFSLSRTSRAKRRFHPVLTMIVSLGVPTGVIAVSAGGYWLTIFTASFAIALATSGTGLLYGRLGLVSLCQFALVGIGGWITLRVYYAYHPPFLLSILAGGFGASAIGVLWGLPALRMRGLHLALATLMLAGAFQVVIANWSFPNGGDSFLGYMGDKPRVDMDRPLLATGDAAYFVYVALILALGLALLEWHRHAKPGRAWALISKSEPMAVASGVNVVFYKAWAFALSGLLAGISGGLLAGCYGGLDGGAFAASDSILLFAVSVIGGIADWQGAVLAALLFRVPPAFLNGLGVNSNIATLFFGAGLIHALMTAPTGISGQLHDAIARRRDRRADRAKATQR